MRRYSLSKHFTTAQYQSVSHRAENGRVRHGVPVRIEPNTTYRTDDDVLIASLESLHIIEPYSKELWALLESTGTPKTIISCATCGGRKRDKIKYKVVVFHEQT